MTEQQMPEMPGFVYIGEIETPRGVFPHYKFREPTDRPSINTLEGWNRKIAELEESRRRKKHETVKA